MQAVVWHARGDVRVQEVPDAPVPGEGEVRVAVDWCGICGTDLEEYRSGPHQVPVGDPHPVTGRKAPLVLGHEVAGRVADVGRGVTHVGEGDLVALDALISCGTCWWCQRHLVTLCSRLAAVGLQADGGLAETVTVPAAMCVPVPAGVAPDTAALAEPLAVAVRGLRRGRLRLGETVVVFGAGMIGLATVVAARAAGAAAVAVVDPNPARRELASRLGAQRVVASDTEGTQESLLAMTADRGFDVAIDAAGVAEVPPAALAATRAGGRIVVVGLAPGPAPIDLAALAIGEKELLGSLSHVVDEDFATAVDLLRDGVLSAGRVGVVKVPLAHAVERGFERLAQPDAPPKVLVGPQRSFSDHETPDDPRQEYEHAGA